MAVSSAHVLHSATWGPALVAAVILAALMHATWNAIAHAVDDRLIGFALIGLVYAVLGAAIVVATGFPSAKAWAYIVASAVVHVAYTTCSCWPPTSGANSARPTRWRGASPRCSSSRSPRTP